MIPADYSYGEFGEFSDFSQHPNYSKKHHSRVSTYDSNFDAAWSDTDVTDAIDDLDGPWHNPIWFGNPAEGKFLEDSVVINMPDFATAKEYSSNAAAYAKLKLHSSPLLVPMNFGGSRLRDIMQDGTSGAGLSLPIPRPRPTTRIEEIANAGATARPKSRPTTMGLPTSKLSILQIEDLAKKKERRAMRLSKTSKNDKKRSTGGTGRIQGTLFERKRKRVDSEEESIGEESSESSSGNMETEEGYSTDESGDMDDSH
ncbi:hypothetical protein BGZ60DRAFT_406029 [Tricladium varicosporioides]|nr:hypothetical protein BGZ60DRAFT_406029 [Hymenoscyphus varicosporioides]